MRAISLWEPWGTAIATGLKKFETRGRATKCRGRLAIHCSQRQSETKAIFDDRMNPSPLQRSLSERMRAAFAKVGIGMPEQFQFGKVIAVCDLVGCMRTDDPFFKAETFDPVERLFGNYESGRFAWRLENVRALEKPFAFRGGQFFFTVPDELFDPKYLAPC